MANTYTQLLVHIVFSTAARLRLIPESSREEVQRYITGIVANKSCRLYAIYVNPDHCHMLISLHPDVSVSSLVKDIKVASTKLINTKRLALDKFAWQEGFGAFTHAFSQADAVVRYILGQAEHHRRFDFPTEYRKMLDDCGLEVNPDYLFKDRKR